MKLDLSVRPWGTWEHWVPTPRAAAIAGDSPLQMWDYDDIEWRPIRFYYEFGS